MELRPDQVYAQLGPLVFGAVDEFGVDWSLQSLDGWGGTGSTSSAQQRTRASGGVASTGYAPARSVALGGMVFAPDAPSLSDAFDRLNMICGLGDAMLTVTEAGRSRWCNARRSGEVLWQWMMPTSAKWSIQVQSEDWRKFGDESSGSTMLPSTSGGLTVPFTVPFSIDSAVVSGQVSLANPGNETGPVRLRIDGPCVGPVITHVSTGAQLVFSSSLVLGVGEWIDVDMEAHTVLANGQSSRAGWVTSRGWSGFDPGDNTWSFAAASYDPASQLTVTAIPAWQ